MRYGLPYKGSKNGIALWIVNNLPPAEYFVDLFCGGGAVTHAAMLSGKWEQFKSYNLRDVETEMQIQQRLMKFPVPDAVWDEYHLDQEINDRGIRVDMPFVKQALAIDEISRNRLTEAMKKLTDLENPNSVVQMKTWRSR